MTTAAVGLGLLGFLVLLPVVAGGRTGVSPRVTATAHLVGLVGWGLLPAVWLACLGGSVPVPGQIGADARLKSRPDGGAGA